MNLGDFREIIRAYVPSAKIQVVPDSLLDTLINKGVDDVNAELLVYKGKKKFDVTAETQDYLFSSVIDDFLIFDKDGLWWNDGSASSPDWKRLDPYTRSSMSANWPNWKDDTSDSPLRYFLDNDILTIHPKPDTTLSEGFWAFYIKKAAQMTDASHYPFTGSTTEIASLSVLDDAIIDYVRWKLSFPLGNDTKGILSKRDYEECRNAKAQLLNRRLDITGHPDLRMRGPAIA